MKTSESKDEEQRVSVLSFGECSIPEAHNEVWDV